MLIAPVLMVDVVMADKIVVTTQMKSNAVILLIFTGNRHVYIRTMLCLLKLVVTRATESFVGLEYIMMNKF